MRVTNHMMMNSFLRNVNNSQNKVSKYNEQVSSGRRMTRLSDDPVGVLDSMNARQKLLRLNQYNDNLSSAKIWVEQSESAMSEINSTLETIYGKINEGSTGTNGAEEKKYLAKEIRELTDHIMQTANTTVGTQYIFGGYNTSNPPFSKDALGNYVYNGLNLSDTSAANTAAVNAEKGQTMQFEIGFNSFMQVSPNGVELMGTGSNSVLNLLNNIATELENNADSTQMTKRLTDIQNAQTQVRQNAVSMGAKAAKIETMENRYSQNIIDFTDVKSKVESVDAVEALLQLKQAETMYNYALQAGARTIQASLLDFLR